MECKYCGQILMDGAECDCPEATREREAEIRARAARNAIDDIFGESGEQSPVTESCRDVLKETAGQIARFEIAAATFSLPNGTKAKLSLSSKGGAKIERAETRKNVMEV